jgi:hypothetical protein
MRLIYEDRVDFQKSMKNAGVREVYIREVEGSVRVTAHIDSRTLAFFETEGGGDSLATELACWKQEHFEVIRGEVSY